VPDGYDSSVHPILKLHYFTPQTVYTKYPTCAIGQAERVQGEALDTVGFGTSTGIILYPHATANRVTNASETLDGSAWTAGALGILVFYREGTAEGDDLDAVLNFLGGDLLIGVTKEMGG